MKDSFATTVVMQIEDNILREYFDRHGLDKDAYISTISVGDRTKPYIILIEESIPRYLIINNTICEYFDSLSDAFAYLDTGEIKPVILENESNVFVLKPYLENCDIRFATPIKLIGYKDGVLVVTLPIKLTTEEVVRAQRNIKLALSDATKRGIINDIQFLVLPEGTNILRLESV